MPKHVVNPVSGAGPSQVDHEAQVVPVRFLLGQAMVSFPGPLAFERWVQDKTQPSGRAWSDLLARCNEELVAECWRDGQTLGLMAYLRRHRGMGASHTAAAFARLDLEGIPDDHRWPEILGGLSSLPERYEAFQRLGLYYYLRYLECRRDALLSLLHDRRRGVQVPCRSPAQWDITQLNGTQGRGARQLPEPVSFRTLTPGRPEPVQDLGSVSLPLRLGTSEFRLVASDNPLVVSPNGLRHRLREGRNLIGRARYNDVVVGSEFRTVSRRHLLVEIRNRRLHTLTDLSSTGTHVPGALLAVHNELA